MKRDDPFDSVGAMTTDGPDGRIDAWAAPLEADGIDVQYPRQAAALALTIASDDAAARDRLLAAIAELVRTLDARAMQLWSPLHFCLPLFGTAAGGDAARFEGWVQRLGVLAVTMHDHDVEPIGVFQHGVPTATRCAGTHAHVVDAALDLAIALAERGISPQETLRHAVAALGECSVADDAAAVARVREALQATIELMEERGVPPVWPIARALAELITAFSDDLDAAETALAELAELGCALFAAGVSPYPVLEHGVANGYQRAAPWIRGRLLEPALALASHGVEPTYLLSTGLPNVGQLDEARGAPIFERVRDLADRGIDAAPFLDRVLSTLGWAAEGDARFDDLVARGFRLVEEIAERGIRPMIVFEDGLPAVLHGEVKPDGTWERVFDLAIDLARHGIDPGPPIKFGVAPALAQLADRPAASNAFLDRACALAANGIDPWRLGESGVAPILRLAGADDAAFARLLDGLDRLIRRVVAMDGDAAHVMTYAIRPLAEQVDGDQALFERLLDAIAALTSTLQSESIDPSETVSRGLPAVAGAARGAPWLVEQAIDLASRTASLGVDPSLVLAEAVPAIVSRGGAEDRAAAARLGERLFETIAALGAAKLETALGVEQVVIAAADLEGDQRTGETGETPDEAFLAATLDALARGAAAGIDTTTPMRDGVRSFARRPAGDRLARLDALTTRLLAAGADGRDLAAIHGTILDRAGRVAPDAAAYANLLERLDALDARAAASDLDAAALLVAAAPLAAEVAGERPEEFARLLEATLDRGIAVAADGVDLAAAIVAGGHTVARLAGDDVEAAIGLLEPLVRLASLRDDDDGSLSTLFLEHALPVIGTAAGEDRARFEDAVADLVRIHEGGVIAGVEIDVMHRVSHLGELVRRLPAAWKDLIVPTLFGQGASSAAALGSFAYLERAIDGEDALATLRHVVTQEGVRAPDILAGLLVPCVRSGTIRSLGEERERLEAFLADVPFPEPDYYREYCAIVADESLGAPERRERIAALHASVEELAAAIVAGELDEEQQRHALLGQVLAWVFPPAYGADRRRYRSLVQSFSDHPEHVAVLQEAGALEGDDLQARLAVGGYCVREGCEIDTGPWAPLLGAIAAVNARTSSGDDEPLDALGRSLFEAWIDGTIGREKPRAALLQRLYARHVADEQPLPDDVDDPSTLLKLREFLADTAREIIQDALRAFRTTDPERYDRQATAKLAPRGQIGRGLAKAVWRTVEAHAAGEVDAEAAAKRLTSQLRGFDLEGEGLASLLGARSKDQLDGALAALEPREADVTLGEEHLRVLADLIGGELAAMQRELFGNGAKGKLEYRRTAGGAAMVIRFEPTKRRAHAPIGICEGVCTATDDQLWERPGFIQVVFWGPDRRALGGMHFLVVEDDGARHLALPGINPSLGLLKEVGADALLDAAFAFARRAAERWGLGEVWIPTARAITSNRGPVRDAIVARELPTRSISTKEFSYSPYRYTFDEVWVLA